MMVAAILAFTLAAMGGLILAVGHRPGYKPPIAIALGHGVAAVTGIILLIIAAFTRPEAMGATGYTSLGLFLVAAMGGLHLHSRRYAKKHTPRLAILLHALAALTVLFLLITAAMY